MTPLRTFNFGSWRPKVLVTHWDIPSIAINYLKEKCDVTICKTLTRGEVLKEIVGVDGVFWGTFNALDKEILDAAGPQLKAIALMSVGMDHVDVEAVKERKIPLGNTPSILNDAVAEIGIGLAIAAGRRFHEGRLKIESSQWEKRPQWLLGQEIRNSTVGIVGFGGIGSTTVKKMQGFDVKEFLYCGRSEKPNAQQYAAKFVSFDELCTRSDFIFITCPLTTQTKHMFNKDAFSKMKSTAVVVNVARGDVVDQEALYDALKNNKIFAAGIDVMTPEPLPSDHPLLTLPNCVIIPHLGTDTVATTNDMALVTAMNLMAGLAKEPLCYPVY